MEDWKETILLCCGFWCVFFFMILFYLQGHHGGLGTLDRWMFDKISDSLMALKMGIFCFLRIVSCVNLRGILWLSLSSFRDKIFLFCGGNLPLLELSKTQNGTYKRTLTYAYNGRKFKVIWETQLWPNKIVSVLDENRRNIIDKIGPYMGPDEKFHGSLISPALIGHKKLTFCKLFSSENQTFEKDQVIILR